MVQYGREAAVESALEELEKLSVESSSSLSSSYQGQEEMGPISSPPRDAAAAPGLRETPAEGAAAPDTRHGGLEEHAGATLVRSGGSVGAQGRAQDEQGRSGQRGDREAGARASARNGGAVLAGNADLEAARAELLFHRASYEESYETSKR